MTKTTLPKAFQNPSYDKSLPTSDRLRDFLGAYHIELNGAHHKPFVKTEEDGGGYCCSDNHEGLIEFVELIVAQARNQWVEEQKKRETLLLLAMLSSAEGWCFCIRSEHDGVDPPAIQNAQDRLAILQGFDTILDLDRELDEIDLELFQEIESLPALQKSGEINVDVPTFGEKGNHA